jgi:RecA-family ATPase
VGVDRSDFEDPRFRGRILRQTAEEIRTLQSLVVADAAAWAKEHQESPNGKTPQNPQRSSLLATYTARELQQQEFPQPKWAVPDLLPEGLTFLAGRPKIGKSWMALNVTLAVPCGGKALGKIEVVQGDALYLALEDTPRRMQGRILALLGSDPFPHRLHLVHHAPKLSEGLEDAIGEWLRNHPEARLVIVDTLARIRKRKAKHTDSYAEDSEAAERLQKLATDYRICLLVVHHLRKAEAEDPLELVSGTFGLTGGADGVLVLKRGRGQADAILSM